MARIQVMPLTEQTVGSLTATPYVVVIDELTAQQSTELLDHDYSWKEELGAQAVLLWEGRLDVVGADVAVAEAVRGTYERLVS